MEIAPVDRWHVETVLSGDGAELLLNLYAKEWGFAFHLNRRSSWIRVRDAAFVHGRDDFDLLGSTPELHAMPAFIASLEHEHSIALRVVAMRTNLDESRVRAWLQRLHP